MNFSPEEPRPYPNGALSTETTLTTRMRKKQLILLLLFIATCIIMYWMPIHNNKSFYTQSQFSNGSLDGSGKVTEADRLIERRAEDFWTNKTKIEGVTVSNGTKIKPLASCPSTAPSLVGPLHVEIDPNRTLDRLRKTLTPTLRKGGRHKPPGCIALQKVAIIIPYRHREEHLKHWLYYLHPILQRQQLDYGVYVINQYGKGTFNRAKLLNVGYVEALKEYNYDCFIFSDVDLIPLDDRNLYGCFGQPRHLAVAMDKFGFKMPYQNFFGGVSSLSKEQYLKINGFPNNYWGWGGEDDDIYQRIIFRGMSVSRPDLQVGRYKMIRHNRDLHNEPNPHNPDKLHRTKWTMNDDGINSLKYTVVETEKDVLYTFITVDIGSP